MFALRRYPNGEERCIAVNCVKLFVLHWRLPLKQTPREDGSRRTTKYEIDVFKCIYCGFCEEACPVDSIVLTSEMHYHLENRGENILTKEKLLAIGDLYEERIAADRDEDEKYR